MRNPVENQDFFFMFPPSKTCQFVNPPEADELANLVRLLADCKLS
jgi:hypothetical protein